MGQAANSGRQASLDEKKARAAGRRGKATRRQIKDSLDEQFAKGKTGGASGKHGRGGASQRRTAGNTQGAGGGGGAGSRPKDAAVAAKTKVSRSSRPARKRGG